tara:strand:+ start:139 stop:465 length:327 start_codon:yes stop_codon:yes gene_type:complete
VKEIKPSNNNDQTPAHNRELGSRAQLYGGGCGCIITVLIFGSTGATIEYHGGDFIDHFLFYSSLIIGIFLLIWFKRLLNKASGSGSGSGSDSGYGGCGGCGGGCGGGE